VRETMTLLDCPDEYQRMSRIHNPYGDGHASERIEAAILKYWGDDGKTPAKAEPLP
jgi:UDP-N-acetylglucosamine 2-epimerase (non-hydrolysing)